MITLDHVNKRFGSSDGAAVTDLSLSIPGGKLCVLVGPSGCGKTTTLRMINRLVEPTSGRILIDDTDILAMDPVELRRGIGYVIQQAGLFPHRRVGENVATVPRLLGWSKERVDARVSDLLHLVGLDPDSYAHRFPHELSGGERQRVGVARALGGDPPILLMDEPFGAVDPVTRARLQQQLLDLQEQLKKTIVFVTHDIEEAAKLGDQIVVMSKGGVVEQYDSPSEILGHPATPFVAEFVGSDRGIRRLSVTNFTIEDLAQPTRVRPDASMAEVARIWEAAGGRSPWALAVDDDELMGWVAIDSDAIGNVKDNLKRFAATIPLDATLHDALSEMLQHDLRWLPVVDHGNYFGIITPNRLHAIMRRTVGGDAAGELDSSQEF